MPAIQRNILNTTDTSVSVEDVSEFEKHYLENRNLWEKAFEWLKNNDLTSIATGKYILDDDLLFVIVSEYQTSPADDIMFEAHRKYIDIQYVATGREKMGVARLTNAAVKIPYNDDKDIAFYDIPESDCRYYEAGSDKYFIFFPADVHKPGIRVGEGENVRKVVVKLRI